MSDQQLVTGVAILISGYSQLQSVNVPLADYCLSDLIFLLDPFVHPNIPSKVHAPT